MWSHLQLKSGDRIISSLLGVWIHYSVVSFIISDEHKYYDPTNNWLSTNCKGGWGGRKQSKSFRTVFKFSGRFNEKSKTRLRVVPLRLTVHHSHVSRRRKGDPGQGSSDGVCNCLPCRLPFLIQLSLVLLDGIHGAAASHLAALVNACPEGNLQML